MSVAQPACQPLAPSLLHRMSLFPAQSVQQKSSLPQINYHQLRHHQAATPAQQWNISTNVQQLAAAVNRRRSSVAPPNMQRLSSCYSITQLDGRPIRKSIDVTKAAAISSAMLARKQSVGRGGSFAFADTKDDIERGTDANWYATPHAKRVFSFAAFLSLVSVSLNTPATFAYVPYCRYGTFAVDVVVALCFSIETVAKICSRGMFRTHHSYMRDRWCQFDLFMVICHWISIFVQIFEICTFHFDGLQPIVWLSVLRSPRPLIMVRFIRSTLQFQLPRNRINQIFKRSSQQIYNVTVFFLFFMALYGILGVQFFGHMDYHCILKNADPNNITIADLMIPDTYCSTSGSGFKCPPNMACKRLKLKAAQEGYYGMFSNIANSIFTVYMAASQEGWVYVMYDCMDSLPSWKSSFYFITLIFFLAWMVKNVFIAVITETFAEIRVQFSQMWGQREVLDDDGFRQVLEKDDDGSWRLVTVDANKPAGWAPEFFQRVYKSTTFQAAMMVVVLANALISASFVHRHDGTTKRRQLTYYYIECGFTVLFNLEAIFKVWCLGWKGYIRRSVNKFEFILCLGTTLNTIRPIYVSNICTCFQVFRVVRLTKASPMLEDFVYKIFGPGKKLGGLVLFTMALLIITSGISLQLFCFVHGLERFRTFPEALMSMFQILTQEGWTEVVIESMRMTGNTLAPVVAIYFVVYHLFVTLIVLSLFVAVILDNLEMEEDLKKIKQLKAQEQSTSSRSKLPVRLRIFTHFPDRPQMVRLKRFPGEFPLPKIRDSFTRAFAEDESDEAEEDNHNRPARLTLGCLPKSLVKLILPHASLRYRRSGATSSKSGVVYIVQESNKSRLLLSDSFGAIPMIGRYNTMKPKGDRKKSVYVRGGHQQSGSIKMKQMYEHLKQNGDLSRPSGGNATGPNRGRLAAQNKDTDMKAMQHRRQEAEMKRNRLEEEMRENHPMFDKPLFLVSRESRFRRMCQSIVYARYEFAQTDSTGKIIQTKYKEIYEFIGLLTYLDWAMVIITIMSCISMMFESPWPRKNNQDPFNLVMFNNYLQIMDYIFVIAMSVELMVKALANGILFTPKAVIRDFGGIMTVFIYLTSLLALAWMPTHVEPMSGRQLLLVFRAMRPLRIYTLVPQIRQVVVEVMRGIREILLVTVLLIVLMFIFASFGVQVAGGKLAKCNDPSITRRKPCKGTYWQQLYVTRLTVPGKFGPDHPAMLVPRVWANPITFNFDHIGNAFLAMFELLSLEGWPEMRDLLNNRFSSNPRNFNFDHIGYAMLALFEILSFKGWVVVRDVILMRLGAWPAVFIHVYVFIGCMIGLTLFVGVVIANYTENRGTALLTVDQRRWRDLKSRLKIAQPLHIPPRPPESARARTFLYDLATSSAFKRFFALLILLNSTLLCFIPWDIEEDHGILTGLTVTSGVFTLAFGIEIVLKAIAFTPSGFWQSKRNRYDFFITVLGVAWIIIHFFVAVAPDQEKVKRVSYTFGYVAIILRFFTITGRHATLKMLMLTVVMSVWRSFFIIAGMFILMLFYAYTGVILFGVVKYGEAIGRHANFRSVKSALLVLFRIVTGEDWNKIMHDCMRSPPYCIYWQGDVYWETDCGNFYGAIFYFCSFYLIITYIWLNLLVAIIMENFSLFYSSDEDALLSYADIRNFQNVWNIVDMEQKGQIPVSRVKFLLRLLRGRLEVDSEKDRLLFKHMCYEMERLHNGEDVSFHDVLNMLSYRSVDIRKSLQLEELLNREELEYIIEEEVAKQTIRNWLEQCLRRIRAKEQNVSIITSLRATNEQLLDGIDNALMSQISSDADGARAADSSTKKKQVAYKERQASVTGAAAVAGSKKLLATPISKTGSIDNKSPPLGTTKRSTLKGSKNLPEVAEGEEGPTTPGAFPARQLSSPLSPGVFSAAQLSGSSAHLPNMTEVRSWWSSEGMEKNKVE